MALTGGEVRLDRSHDGRVAELVLAHGPYTVITWEMRQLMAERFAEIDADPAVKVVVLRSAGEHFSSGGDIAGFMEVDPVDFTDLGHNVTAPARSPKPVIAASTATASASASSWRCPATSGWPPPAARFALPEMKLGMIPGSGGTQRLARLIGLSRAKYHVLTGERINRSRRWTGVSSPSVADDATGSKKRSSASSMLLGYSSIALRTAKEVLDRGVDGPLYTGIELERKAYSMLRASHDFAEGVAAFGEKRAPKFEAGE